MKISIKSVITIIGLFSGVNLWTMSDQRFTCAVDLSESKREQEREDLNLIPVDLPQTWGPQEKINKEEDEIFTAGTFGELMEDQFKRDEEYIIARVVTRDEKDKRYVHYFDAHSLNAHMYGKYPIEKWEIKEKVVNPLNRLKIEDVDYFGIKEGEKSFSFICNSRELLEDRRETLENKFYLNCNNTSLQFNLGNKYYDTRKYKMAEEYYLRVGKPELKKNEGLVQWIQANARLGDIYYYGLGIGSPDNQKKEILQNTLLPKELVDIVSSYLTNYIKAREHYERVATEDCNIKMRNSPWVRVNNNLGDIYYNGLGLKKKDFAEAKKYYERVATVQVNYENIKLWMNANCKMGKMYFYGQGLLKKNCKRAKEYYERIVKPEYERENLEVWLEANLSMGYIYFTMSNRQKAKEYLEKIATDKIRDKNFGLYKRAVRKLSKLDEEPLSQEFKKARREFRNSVIAGNTELAKAILIRYPCLINNNMMYVRPLEYVIKNNDIEMLKVFFNVLLNFVIKAKHSKFRKIIRQNINKGLKLAQEKEKGLTIQPMTDLLLDWKEKDKSIKNELDTEAGNKEEEEDQVI